MVLRCTGRTPQGGATPPSSTSQRHRPSNSHSSRIEARRALTNVASRQSRSPPLLLFVTLVLIPQNLTILRCLSLSCTFSTHSAHTRISKNKHLSSPSPHWTHTCANRGFWSPKTCANRGVWGPKPCADEGVARIQLPRSDDGVALIQSLRAHDTCDSGRRKQKGWRGQAKLCELGRKIAPSFGLGMRGAEWQSRRNEHVPTLQPFTCTWRTRHARHKRWRSTRSTRHVTRQVSPTC